MKRRFRNYQKEYQNRIKHGLAKGRSHAHARGHARTADVRRKHLTVADPSDPRERALALMKAGKSQRAAAKLGGVSVERLRRYLEENTRAKRKGRKWIIVDRRPVIMVVASEGDLRWITVRKRAASKIGHYWNAVNKFLDTNKRSYLAPFKDGGVYDADRKFHPWETRPNILRRLDSVGELSLVDLYRNTAN
jgi:hypothetical protein